jgi:hypothetical protein
VLRWPTRIESDAGDVNLVASAEVVSTMVVVRMREQSPDGPAMFACLLRSVRRHAAVAGDCLFAHSENPPDLPLALAKRWQTAGLTRKSA